MTRSARLVERYAVPAAVLASSLLFAWPAHARRPDMSLLPVVALFVAFVVLVAGVPFLLLRFFVRSPWALVPVSALAVGLVLLAWALGMEAPVLAAHCALAGVALVALALARVAEGERPRARLAVSTILLVDAYAAAIFFAAVPPPFAASLAGWEYDHPACHGSRAPADDEDLVFPPPRWARRDELLSAGVAEADVALASDPQHLDAQGHGEIWIRTASEAPDDVAWICTAYLAGGQKQRSQGCTLLRLATPLLASGVPPVKAARRFDFVPEPLLHLGKDLVVGCREGHGTLRVLDEALHTIAERSALGSPSRVETTAPSLLVDPSGDLRAASTGAGELTLRRLHPDLRDAVAPMVTPAPPYHSGSRHYLDGGAVCYEEEVSGNWMGFAVDGDLRPIKTTPLRRIAGRLARTPSLPVALLFSAVAAVVLRRRARSARGYAAWLVITWAASLVPISTLLLAPPRRAAPAAASVVKP